MPLSSVSCRRTLTSERGHFRGQGQGASCPGDAPEGERSVEIVLPDSTRLRVAESIGAAALRRLLLVLRG
jgi:hypothetical protein